MSPGNFYRYVRSKEAIVAGLCACDQEELAANIRTPVSRRPAQRDQGDVCARHLVEEPRQRFQMIVEIWAEATLRSAESPSYALGFEMRTFAAGWRRWSRARKASGSRLLTLMSIWGLASS